MGKNPMGPTVDVAEIQRSPVDMVNIPLFTMGFVHPRWFFGISSINLTQKGNGYKKHRLSIYIYISSPFTNLDSHNLEFLPTEKNDFYTNHWGVREFVSEIQVC